MIDILLFIIIFGAYIFFLLCGLTLLFLIWHQFITKNAPYVLIPKEILPEIFKTLEINEESVVYDLGSGNGGVLFHLYNKEPEAKYVGIDISPWPIASSKIMKWKNFPNSNIEFKRGDILEEDLSSATHIFAYLSTELTNKLLPKLERELNKGTTFVSCDFFLDKKIPEKILNLEREGERRGKKLYVYKF